MAEDKKAPTRNETKKTIALELLADRPEEERRIVEAMPASCISIGASGSLPYIEIKNLGDKFGRANGRGDFLDLPNDEYSKLLDDVSLSTPFQGDAGKCSPDAMVALVTAYGKSIDADEPFEAGFAFLKPRLDNIRKYL